MRFMITIRVSRAIIPYLLERWSRVNGDTARRLAPVLSQSGEFAVVLFAADAIPGCDRRAYGKSAYARDDFVGGRFETEGDPTMQFMIIVKANSR